MTTQTTSRVIDQPLALLGGPPAVDHVDEDLFHWPIVTEEDEQAVLDVIRNAAMSGLDITADFADRFAAFQGVRFALGYPNGTMSLLAAMYAVGVRRGDEIIAPSMTYWASVVPVFSLGATVVFADIDPAALCIDPGDIEHRITERTRAIVAVHYSGHPCDMDPIMQIAARHNIKVIEDVSHAHGGRYKGRMVGSIGDAACFSMMTLKAIAIGEAGMLCTNDRALFEQAVAFSHYACHDQLLTMEQFRRYAGVPVGGVKGRMNQTCAAMGRVQLKHYPRRMAEIQSAMHRFWDLLEDVPGLAAHRTARESDSTMGGWYNPVGLYDADQLGGLDVQTFKKALAAEGIRGAGCNAPLHLHPVLNTADIYNDGKTTRIAFSDRDLRQGPGSLPHCEAVADRTFGIPWFKHDRSADIERHAAALRKVVSQADQLTAAP